MKHGPWAPVSDLDRREVDSVEVNIIFAHELVQADVGLVKPPPFPFGCVVGRDTWVSNTCLKL